MVGDDDVVVVGDDDVVVVGDDDVVVVGDDDVVVVDGLWLLAYVTWTSPLVVIVSLLIDLPDKFCVAHVMALRVPASSSSNT